MILILLIPLLLACEFNFVDNQDMKEVSYDIPLAEFTALGIWTRYYTFYLNISIEKEEYNVNNDHFYVQQIMTGSFNDGTELDYILREPIVQKQSLMHQLKINGEYFNFTQLPIDEGVWMFTYIGIDNNIEQFNIYLLNTKTDQFQLEQHKKQINSIKLNYLEKKTHSLDKFHLHIVKAHSQNLMMENNF